MKETRKYDHRCMLEEIEALKRECAGMFQTGVAGYSVMGREIPWLSAGNGGKMLLMLGTHHGREYITSAFLMEAFRDFLERGAAKGRLVILPMVNPDGVEISIHGATENIAGMPLICGTYAAWKANGRGVDLNRNYPCLWERKKVEVSCPASEAYNGPYAASEPEVRAVMEFTERLSPQLAVTMHTKGEEIYWADSNTPELWAESLPYAECIESLSGYALMPPSQDPAVYAAGYENWFRQQFGRPCILIEAGRYDGPQPFEERLYDREIRKKLRKISQALMFRLNDT